MAKLATERGVKMAVSLESSWHSYRQTRSEEARRVLLEAYLPLVRQVVGRLRVKLPPHLDYEDLAGMGVLGLMDALDRFDPARGVKFETYAGMRIRGAILDELRQTSWIPRSVTDKLKLVNETCARLEQETGGAVDDRQLAAQLGIPVSQLEELWLQANFLSVVSLEEFLLAGDGEDGIRLGNSLADPASPDPVSRLAERELEEALARGIQQLGEKDRLVLSLYYHEGLTLKEIGRVLGVTESRVCQLHGRALGRLRQSLAEYV